MKSKTKRLLLTFIRCFIGYYLGRFIIYGIPNALSLAVKAEKVEYIEVKAGAKELYEKKLHPYTQALLSAVPVPVWGAQKNRIILKGDVPSPINPPAGCRFNPRCFKCGDICKNQEPENININDRHTVVCHLYKVL